MIDNTNIWILGLLIPFFIACNEIPPQIPPIEPPSGDRKVLIEEFSGVQCVNCPEGAAQIANLKALYGDRVIAVTMHAPVMGVLSAPFNESKFDFRTEVSDEIFDFLGRTSGIPAAAIDRFQFEGEDELLLGTNQWAAKVEQELEKDAPVGISLNPSYDSISRELNIEVVVFAQESIQGDIRFHMGLMESGMVDLQLDGTTVIEEYEHNHILRTYLTDATGDIISSSLPQGENWTRTYEYILPEGDGWWIAENMDIVAFVSNVTPNSKAVLQAEEASVVSE